MSADWVFGEFCLQRHARALQRGDQTIQLGARAFDVLCVLAEHAGQVVTKASLFDRVWPNLVVEENNLQVHVSTLRKILGAASITTVAGKGYCFTLKVLELGAPPTAAPKPELEPTPAALKRSVAVLPFVNLNTEPGTDYFSDGIAEDVITHLTRSRWLFVASRNSSFTFRGAAVPAPQVAHDLGVRYVVYGTVRKAGLVLRVSCELVDGLNGETLWSQRFDRSPEDLFAVQDEIASAITSAIEPVYLKHQEHVVQKTAPNELERWDLLMRARWHFWRSTREHLDKARTQLDLALALNPEDPAALSLLAFVSFSRVWAGWSSDARQEIAHAQKLAKQAVLNDEHDAFAHFTLGTAWSFTGHVDRAISSLTTALELYPQFAAAAGELGRMHAFSGQADEAHEYALQAIDASPSDPHVSLWLRTRAIACFTQAQYPQALVYAKAAAAKRADWFFNHYLVAACASACGLADEASAAVRQASNHGAYPMAALKHGHPFTQANDLERFVIALREAGWQG